jgi:hypothetical protein
LIFTDKFLFLHFPKTGGMMLSNEFRKKLKGKIYYSVPKGHLSPYEKFAQLLGQIKVVEGLRHENLADAEQLFMKYNLPHRLSNFELILLLVRNPYELMVSRYFYLKNVQKHNREGLAARLASELSFNEFVLNAPLQSDINSFLNTDNSEQEYNISIVKYENMHHELNPLMRNYLKRPLSFNKKLNTSKHQPYQSFIEDEEVENRIYIDFKILFDKGFYNRIQFR